MITSWFSCCALAFISLLNPLALSSRSALVSSRWFILAARSLSLLLFSSSSPRSIACWPRTVDSEVCRFVTWAFCQSCILWMGILSVRILTIGYSVNRAFYQLRILSNGQWAFCKSGILSIGHSVNWTFCQFGTLSIGLDMLLMGILSIGNFGNW